MNVDVERFLTVVDLVGVEQDLLRDGRGQMNFDMLLRSEPHRRQGYVRLVSYYPRIFSPPRAEAAGLSRLFRRLDNIVSSFSSCAFLPVFYSRSFQRSALRRTRDRVTLLQKLLPSFFELSDSQVTHTR